MTAAPVIARSALAWKVSITGGLQQLVFDKASVVVGRETDCDIVIDQDLKVSRKHFCFELRGSQLWVKNLSEKNSIFVNQQKVDEAQITQTSLIQAGDTIFKVEVEIPTAPRPKPPPPIHLKSLEPVFDEPTKAGINVEKVPPPFFQPSEGFSAGPSGSPKVASRVSGGASGGNSKVTLYILVLAAIGGLMYFDGKPTGSSAPPLRLAQNSELVQSLGRSQDLVSQIKEDKEKSGENTLNYKTAQEHYLKGFRDYQNGQYSRAVQSFQAALSFFPNHALAQRYKIQAEAQLKKLYEFHMRQGMEYRSANNFRLCKASYQKALILIKDQNNPAYQQSKQYFDECSLRVSEKGAL